MCLTAVSTCDPKQTKGTGYKIVGSAPYWSPKGWKISYGFLFKSLAGIKTIQFGKWLQAEDTTGNQGIRSECGTYYPTGFHVYKNKKEAIQELSKYNPLRCLVRVQYRKAKALGEQDGVSVIVADQIKFLKTVRVSKKERGG